MGTERCGICTASQGPTPERIFELYAGTEAQAATVITGIEWLEHPGSVGRVSSGEVRICDPDGNVLPPGEHPPGVFRRARIERAEGQTLYGVPEVAEAAA